MASSSSQSPREGGAAPPWSIPRRNRAVAAAHRSRPRARLERQENGPRRARSSFMTDYFTVFGLPRKLAVDAPALQRRFYELSREHHPDFHHGADAARQAEALAASALVNRAYRALPDPLARVGGLYALQAGRLRVGVPSLGGSRAGGAARGSPPAWGELGAGSWWGGRPAVSSPAMRRARSTR